MSQTCLKKSPQTYKSAVSFYYLVILIYSNCFKNISRLAGSDPHTPNCLPISGGLHGFIPTGPNIDFFSGASGAIYGVRLLQVLRDVTDIETHLVMSQAARQTLSLETDFSLREVQALADVTHDARDIAASISSGSFQTLGMVILPCSIKTLSGIVHSYTDGLLTRAADVVLKERRPLVLCVRETPLHLGHLRLMTQAAEIGAVIMPPVPAFYHRPHSLDDVINQTVNRVLDQFAITLPEDLFARWQGA